MTALSLPAIRALLEGVTPGPWEVERVTEGRFAGLESRVYSFRGSHILLSATDGEAGQARNADAAFIAAAPSIVAQLLAVVERVEGLAASWEARGEHDMKFSKTIPDEDIAMVILTEGAAMVENARHIRNAIKGGGPVSDMEEVLRGQIFAGRELNERQIADIAAALSAAGFGLVREAQEVAWREGCAEGLACDWEAGAEFLPNNPYREACNDDQ